MRAKLQKILLKDIGFSQTGPFGTQLHENDYVEKGTPIVTVEHLQEEGFSRKNLPFVSVEDTQRLSKFILRAGDIVFSRVGAVDRCTYVTDKEDGWLFSGRCLRVRILKEKANPRFINFYFRQKEFKKMMRNIAVGAIMLSLNTKLMDNIKLHLLPISEQNKIAQLLDSIDNKIILNHNINTELENIAKMLYNYWFVQFDFPDEFGRPYKSSGGKMVYNEELKREIPVGWKVKNVTDVIEWIGGAQPPKSTFIYEKKDGYIRFIQNRDYADNNNLTYIKESPSNKTCNAFDIMMDKYGEAGKVRYGLAGAYNVALAKIKVNIPNAQEYIRKFFESEAVCHYLSNACMASTRASLNEDILKNLLIAIPHESILQEFETQAKNILFLILKNKSQNEKLSSLRDFLLPMLMNGQVTINS